MKLPQLRSARPRASACRAGAREAALTMAAVVTATVALAGCASGDGPPSVAGADGLQHVQVSLTPVADLAPYWLGVSKGFYEDEGLDVEILPNQGGAAALPAVMSGQVPFSSANSNTLYVAADGGLQPRILLTSSASTGVEGKDSAAMVVARDSPLRSAADMANPDVTVSVNTLNSIGTPLLRAAIEKDGGDPSKVKLVEIAFPDVAAALDSGQIDAGFLVEPFLSAYLAANGRAISWPQAVLAPQLPITSLYTSAQTQEKNPEMVDKFVRASEKSVAYAADHPQEVRDSMLTFTKLTKEQIAQMTLPLFDTGANIAGYQAMADQVVKDGAVKKAPDLHAILPAQWFEED